VKTRELAQNFLKNQRTARHLVDLADGPDDALFVDLGAGKGAITEAAVALRSRVLAIEKDPRLVRNLKERFGNQPWVEIREGDLLGVSLPTEPFVLVSNPPFNLSTQLVRRWLTAEHFRPGAIIVERAFARRISGQFGTTKLSASLGAYLHIEIPVALHPAEFHPQPRVPTVIMTAARLPDPLIPWEERRAYWLFVNYLFERSHLTVGQSLSPLRIKGLPARLSTLPVRSATVEDVVSLYNCLRNSADRRWYLEVESFDRQLPAERRVNLSGGRSAAPR